MGRGRAQVPRVHRQIRVEVLNAGALREPRRLHFLGHCMDSLAHLPTRVAEEGPTEAQGSVLRQGEGDSAGREADELSCGRHSRSADLLLMSIVVITPGDFLFRALVGILDLFGSFTGGHDLPCSTAFCLKADSSIHVVVWE